MICPVCKSTDFNSKKLNQYLDSRECNNCEGIWIPGYNYAKFLEKRALYQIETGDIQFSTEEMIDSKNGKTCPDCGKAVIARKVGMGLNFHVERCDHCFGIWLDKGEWEALEEKKLIEKINYIFSNYWQAKVAEENVSNIKKNNLVKLLGSERAEKIIEFISWVDDQPEKKDIKRYLI